MLPQKRPEDRMRFFREFVIANLRTRNGVKYVDGKPTDKFVEPTDQDISESLTLWKSREWESIQADHFIESFFAPWFHRYTRQLRKKRAESAAAGRWCKKNS